LNLLKVALSLSVLAIVVPAQGIAQVYVGTSQHSLPVRTVQVNARLIASQGNKPGDRQLFSFGPCNFNITNPEIYNYESWGNTVYTNAGITCTSGYISTMNVETLKGSFAGQHVGLSNLDQRATGTSTVFNLFGYYYCTAGVSQTYVAASNVAVTVGSTVYQTEIGSSAVSLPCD
jgi:hypothetical protein